MIILCIDDDPDDTDFFCEAIKVVSPEAKCMTANDGLSALKILRSEILPDIIFLDINMPRMSGREVLMQIKKSYKLSQVPIIIYSTTILPRDVDNFRNLGAHDVLAKYIKLKDLCDALRVILKKFASTVDSKK
ncbi:MAG TPA: response regulator [Chryseolinea sp.]|nr:response regulator [Chryseolinea sp.]